MCEEIAHISCGNTGIHIHRMPAEITKNNFPIQISNTLELTQFFRYN